MRVRVASSADARRIAEVNVRTWQAAYRGQVPDEYLDSLSVEERESGWFEILGGSNLPVSGVFVIEDDNRAVVGFVGLSPSSDPDATSGTGEVGAIYVLREHWGTGFGWALLEQATESLREAACSSATLWVLDSNTRARSFYERAGWAFDGQQKIDDRGTFSLHEVRYRRTL
jgi:ribosomal protein S18 acetylase RimI-like enzyme